MTHSMNGFLIIDKPSGMSSYDVIRKLKRIRPFTKIGYIGTLDRNATGILPVALNEGAKLIAFLEDGLKAYKASFLLGTTTDTLDIEGTVLTAVDTEEYDRTVLDEILQRFRGKITQQIPMYSAKRVKKKPLYKWARAGVAMETPQKDVEIFDITLLDYTHPYVNIEVTCSKGTYIRTLAHDFGNILGCGATLYTLKRTRHGEFFEEMCIDLEKINNDQDLLNSLVSLKNVLKSIKETVVEAPFEKYLKQGMPIPLPGNSKEWVHGEITKLLDTKEALIGIGMADTLSKTIKIKRLINN
ncbi:MAG: tRNA pseudouridine(55) synthase TruB [Syntrophus sp. (in: bacteria)]|nr:tRNA pseudouridine(55) synthase TruB [Syntrophus sp. (in: bacteria)]